MKRTLSFLLTLLMLVTSLPLNAFLALAEGIVAEEAEEEAAAESLQGKTISILGASISTYAGTSNDKAAETTNSTIGGNAKYYPSTTVTDVGLEDTWWMQATDDLGLRLLVNNSWSGSSLLHTRNGTVGAYVDRCVQLHDDTGENAGEEPDIIAIQMGTNDYQYYKDTLGTADIDYASLIAENADGVYTYAEPQTSLEAAAIVLHKISVRYPNAEVYYLNLSKRVDITESTKGILEQFNADLALVCSQFGANVVDIYGSAITVEAFDTFIGDGRVHPNKLGMDAYTEAFKKAVLENTKYTASYHTVSMALENATADYGTDKLVMDGDSFTLHLNSPDRLQVTVTMDGKDVTASVYADGVISIPAITGDVTITAKGVHLPKHYRWVFDGTDLVAAIGNNTLTKTAGTTAEGVFTSTEYALDSAIVLRHDLPWAVEWKCQGTWKNSGTSSGGRLFTSTPVNAEYNARYLFKSATKWIIAMGEKTTTGSHNYGIALEDYGIDGSALHTYRLENRIAADGSNMIYLSVDDEEIGAMNHYYVGTTDKNTTSDWLSGKDFTLPYIGTDTHGLTNCSIEYIEVWENTHPASENWPILNTDLTHIICYGQSFSTGSDAPLYPDSPVDGVYVLGSITSGRSGDSLKTLDLITGNQHPIISAGNSLQQKLQQAGIHTDLILGSYGSGGRTIAQLMSDARQAEIKAEEGYTYDCLSSGRYEVFQNSVSALAEYAENNGKTVGCPVIVYLQGETDQNTDEQLGYPENPARAGYGAGGDKEKYKEYMTRLKEDMQKEVMEAYGQSEKPLFLIYQVSGTYVRTQYSSINMAQLEFARENEDVILVQTPYFTSHYTGSHHLTVNGYRWLGEHIARSMYTALVERQKSYPLLPEKVTYESQRSVRITVSGAENGLTVDTWTVEDATDSKNKYGFYLTVNGTTVVPQTVSVDGNEILLTLPEDGLPLNKANSVYVYYGGKGAKGTGNIRDNCSETGFYAYLDDSNDTGTGNNQSVSYSALDENGDSLIGRPYPLYNWLASFCYELEIPAEEQKQDAFYHWEMQETGLVSVSEDQNELTLLEGTVENGILNGVQYGMAKPVVLYHDKPWAIQWKAAGNGNSYGGGMLLAGDKGPNLYLPADSRGFVAWNQSNNYGFRLKDLGIDTRLEHTYRIENRIASDGTNTIYLTVDGAEIGAMNVAYSTSNSSAVEGTTDWANGTDICLRYMGLSTSFLLKNLKLSYLKIWECTHIYQSTVTPPTCTEKGYTTYTCECGESYVEDETEATGHSYENDICTICGAKAALSLSYDDHYDVTGKEVEIVDAGTPTSYQVGYGVAEGTLDTAVVTLAGDKLIATGIGTAKVKIDGVTYTVTVKAAPISLLLLIGQSNMRGSEGDPNQSIVCPDGMVYATYGDDRGASNTAMTVDNATNYAPSALTGVGSLLNVNGNTDCLGGYPLNSLTAEGAGRMGPDSGFAYEWVKQTGEKVWIVNAAHGGTSITTWQKGKANYEEALLLFGACQETLRKEIAAGHYTLSHMGYFWCQGCTDRTQTAKWYVEKYLAMHENLKKDLAFDEETAFEFGGIIPVRVGSTATCYRDGVQTETNSYAYHESFVDLRMNGPRVAQYWMINNPELSDIWGVCNIGDDWVWMPDGTNGVQAYFNAHYENGRVDYTTQVAQKESWYTPTTPKAVHDSIHYNQIGYNEIGRESARNALILLGEISAPEVEPTVEFVSWDGFTPVESINANTTPGSETLVVPVVSPVWKSKEVTYSLSEGLTWEYYDLLAVSDTQSGTLSSPATTQTVTVSGHAWSAWETVFKPTAEGAGQEKRICADCGIIQTRVLNGVWQLYDLASHMQTMPENYCKDTNLWAVLEHDPYYFASGTKWGIHSSREVPSVTIPVNPGDKIFATSFGKAVENGHESANGIRVTFFGEYGVVKTMDPAGTYKEFSANGGFLVAPEGAIAINVAMWNGSDDNELYILNREHSYTATITPPTCTEKGYTTYTCTGCGDSYVADETAATGHTYANGICTVCGEKASPYLQQLPENIIGCTNLYDLLTPVKGYYTATKYDTSNGDVLSVVIPVEPGDRISASSFGSVSENMGSANGIRVTYLLDGVIVESLSASSVYTAYTQDGYLTVPEGVNMVCVPWWKPSENNWLNLSQVSKDYEIHKPKNVPAQAPTCTENGYTAGEICEICNASIGTREEIPAVGHKFSGNFCTVCGAFDISAFLSGKYVSILGDSISTFNGYSNDGTVNTTIGANGPRYDVGPADTKPGSYCLLESVDDTWWMHFANRNGMHLLVNNSWAGSQVFGGKTADGRVIPAAYLERCVNLHDNTLENNPNNAPIDPDVIFVYLGINDYNFNRTSVGSGTVDYAKLIGSDGTYVTPATFGEAYGILLHKMKTAYPEAQIFAMTLLPENLYSIDMAAWEMHNAYIRAAADYYGIPVVDLAENCAITWENYSGYMMDKIHPTTAGMKLISDCIQAELTAYYTENPPHIHTYTATVTKPTCTAKGYTTYTCSCGDSYVADETAATGHDLISHGEKLPTCTEKGWPAYETCSRCDHSTYTEVAPFGHSYQRLIRAIAHRGYSQLAPENTLAAYELAKEMGYLFAECDVAFTADGVPVLLHDDTIDRTSDGTGKVSELTYEQLLQYDFGSWKSSDYAGTRIPTFEEFISLCARLGLKPYIELKKTGVYSQERVDQLVEIVKAYGLAEDSTWISFSATFLDYVKNADPTARLGYIYSGDATEKTITTAKKLRTGKNEVFLELSYSKITDTGVLRAAANDFAIEVWTVNSKSAILALSPYVTGVTSDKLNAQSIIDEASATVTKPTCTEKGYTTYTCTACSDSYVADETAATGHTYTATVTKPTCTAEGYTTYTCHCGDSYVADKVSATGHTFGEWTTTKEPTCTANGEQRRDCKNCDHYETKVIAATGHSYTATVTKPTCTEGGYTTYTCKCGHSYVADETAATGHSYTATVTKPTATTQGYTTYACVCGDSYVTDHTEPTKEFKLLLIGNSFSEDASSCGQGMKTSQLLDILQAMLGEDVKITLGLCYSGGKGINWHATQADRGANSYSLRVITTETGAWKSYGSCTSAYALTWTDWDVVTLQHYELNPATGKETVPYPETTDEKFYLLETASEFMLDHIYTHVPHADLYFYSHWTRAKNTSLNNALDTYNKWAEFLPSVLEYQGTQTGAKFKDLIPVGLSVQNARTTYLALLAYNTTAYADGNLNLVTDAQIGLQRDGGHLSFNIGRYIAGLTFAEMIIPPEMRAPGYVLPDIRVTESIGVLPKEYTEIAQKAVWAAVESWKNGSLAVTEISGYTEDPAITAKKELEAQTLQMGCQASNEALKNAFSALVSQMLGADFAVGSVTLPEGFTLTGKEQTFTATVSVRFGYTTVDVTVSGTIASHSYTATITKPTCTEQGYTTYTCSCGHSYVDTYTEAAGHSFGAWETVKAPAEGIDGILERKCKNCDANETVNLSYHFSHLTYVAFGDSITYGIDGVDWGLMAHPYPNLVTETLGFHKLVNKAVSGATFCENSLGRKNMTQVILSYTGEADVISLMLGVNDFYANLPLGTAESRDNTTVYGSLHLISQYLTTHYADSFIFYMTPFPAKKGPYANGQGYKLEDVANAIKEVAAEYGIPVLDTFTLSKYEKVEMNSPNSDGVHPSQSFTREYAAPMIVKFIAENYNAKHPHHEVILPGVTPSCTASGLSEGKVCSVCGAILVAQEVLPATGHSFGQWETIKKATCTADGEQRRDCKNCEHYETNAIPATGHSYNAVVTKPTCTAEGYTTYTCHCGDSYVADKTPAKGHAFGEWYTVKEATCTNYGMEQRNCKNCDHYETNAIPATGHSYNAVVMKPTCTTEGYTTYTCHCGDTYVADKIPATGHSYSAWETTKEPTCTENGSQRRDCKNCEHFETKEIPATGHSYNAVVTKPTCTTEGYTTYTCHCGDSYVSDKVSATGHDYHTTVTPPTCTEKGYSTHTCHCGDFYIGDYTPAAGHAWNNGVVTKEPTEESEGTMLYTCTACGDTKEETVPTLEHVHRHEATVTDPTCTEQGYATYTCRCGDSYVADKTPAKGHSFGEWYTVKEATCAADGLEQRDCKNCDHFETQAIPATGHSYQATVTKPTCAEEGYTTYTCHCGDSYVSDYANAIGHAWSEWQDVAPGKEERSCETCGETETRDKTPNFDVDGNGTVEEADLPLLMSILAGNTETEELYDFDFDGKLTIYDGVLLMQQLS